MLTRNRSLLSAMIFVIAQLVACDTSTDNTKTDPAENELVVKTYDVSEVRAVVDLSRGFRPLFEKNGIIIVSEERIHDSAPSSMLIVRARSATHKEIAELFDRLIGPGGGSSRD